MNIELYKFIKPPEYPDPQHLISSFKIINIPTEYVIRSPQFVVPYQARFYHTHLYNVNGKVLKYDELTKQEEFKGSSYYDKIVLVEVWSDCGDDGHTEYYLKGWRYVPFSRLEEELNGHSWFKNGGLPFCMRCFDNYEEEHKNLKEQIYKYENNLSPYSKG